MTAHILLAYDLDDTLVNFDQTSEDLGKIGLLKQGSIVKMLTRFEYYQHVLNHDEAFDYSEFKDSNIFEKTAKPTKLFFDSITNTLKNDFNHNYMVAVVTARCSFDDQKHFLSTLERMGLDVGRIAFKMCGDYDEFIERPVDRKKHAFREIYDSNPSLKYSIFFDDQEDNLRGHRQLKLEYPTIVHQTHKVTVNPNGYVRIEEFL